MLKPLAVMAALGAALLMAGPATAAIQAPDTPVAAHDTTTPDCVTPPPAHVYAWYHCYGPADRGQRGR
jgi:hypothetical protein